LDLWYSGLVLLSVSSRNKRKRKKGKRKKNLRGPKPPFRQKHREGGHSSTSGPDSHTHTPGKGEGGSGSVAGNRPMHARSTPSWARERAEADTGEEGERFRKGEVAGGGLRLFHGRRRRRFGKEGGDQQKGSKGWTEPTPSQPKSNPKTGPLAWIRGGFPLLPIYC